MRTLHDDAHPLRFQDLGDRQRDLLRQPLLHLQPSAEHLRQPGQLGKSQHPAVGDIPDMHLPDEGDHVMLAERKGLDVLDDDQFVVVFMEDGAVDQVTHIFLVAFGEVHQRFCITLRGIAESFAVRVFAYALEDCAHGGGEFVEAGLRLERSLVEARACAGARPAKAIEVDGW